MGFLSRFFYKRKLKAFIKSRSVEHRFLNLKEVKKVVVAMQCDDYSQLRHKEREIKSLISSISNVSFLVHMGVAAHDDMAYVVGYNDVLFSKESIDHKCIPSAELIEKVDQLKPDLFVNVESEESLVIDFLAQISLATMRVGFEGKSECCDLMIGTSGKKKTDAFFNKLLQLLEAINVK